MDKKIAALLGSVASVATLGGAQAMPATPANTEPLAAHSYADLLAPVPNAVEQLKADDIARASMPAEQGVKLAQDHHHHHHNTVIIEHRRHSRHHHHHHHTVIIKHRHHHHHHNSAFIGVPGIGGVVVHSDHD